MEKIYFTYRRMFTNRGDRQDVSFYNDKQYFDYVSSGLTKMTDGSNFIPDDRIVAEIVPWVKKLRVAGMLEFAVADLKVELEESLKLVAQSFSLEIKTEAEMLAWIKDNTDLVLSEWKGFLISEANELEGSGEATYLLI